LAEFTKVDARVASGGVERKMAEQIGDRFERYAPLVQSRRQGMPEDMDSLVA